jgi:hypothetical protein
LADAVEEVGSNEGDVPAGEDIELDHNSGLWREEKGRVEMEM